MKQKHTNWFFTIIVAVALFASCAENATNLVPVSFEGKWGYINSKGEFVISPRYKDAGFFYDDLAMVKDMHGNIGYINKEGQYIIEPKYKAGTMFNEKRAIVVERGEYPVCIDNKGNIVTTMKNIIKLYNFREGMAAFQDTSKKYGFINTKGEIVIPAKYDNVFFGFNEELAPVLYEGKWGYIDKKDKMVIANQFHTAGLFYNGLAVASTEVGNLYGYIGKNGLFKIDPQFDEASAFSEKKATVKIGEKYAAIKTNGKIDVNPVFDKLYYYSNGYALMKLGDMYGYLNADGNMAINAQFSWGTDFYDGFAVVKTFNQYGEYTYGLIDEAGRFKSFPNLEDAKPSYINYNEEDNYVFSDYYDASEFVKKFTKKVSDANTFDGFTAQSTVQSIVDSKLYGDYANAIDSMTVFALNLQKFTKDITCNITEFDFDSKIYSIDSIDNKTKIYNLETPIATISYQFNLMNKAKDKGCAIAKALSNGMANALNATKESKEGIFYVLQDENKCNFVILYSDTTISMAVNFDKNRMQTLLDSIESQKPKYVAAFFSKDNMIPTSGDVQMLLSWNNSNDIDLSCIDPNKEKIYFAHKRSKSGGFLEIDKNATYISMNPIENIFWPEGKAPKGHYSVYVNLYRVRTEDPTTPYTVLVKHGEEIDTFTGTLTKQGEKVKVFEFDIK